MSIESIKSISSSQEEVLKKEVSSLVDKYCPIKSRYLNKQPMVDDIVQAFTTFLEEHYDELLTDDLDELVIEYSYELRIFEIIYGLKDKVLEVLEENCEFRRINDFDLKLEGKISDILSKVINITTTINTTTKQD